LDIFRKNVLIRNMDSKKMKFDQETGKIAVIGSNRRAKSIFEYLKSHYLVYAIKPEDFNNIEKKSQINFDIGILAGYGEILSKERLDFFENKLLTCHGGLLPEYRGSSPMNWAIITGQKYFGLSVITTNPRVDSGFIYESARFDILDEHTINDLHNISIRQFPFLVHSTILKIENNIPPVPQINSMENYYPIRDKNDAYCDFKEMAAIEILNLFRAVVGVYDNPWFLYKHKKVTIYSVSIIDNFHGIPGKIYKTKENKLLIKCKESAVWIGVDDFSVFSKYEKI
jgi:methionyl-tRNA formyltransferase